MLRSGLMEFMKSFQECMAELGRAVTAQEISSFWGKPETRVRSAINLLRESGYVCLAGKARSSLYVAGLPWSDEEGCILDKCPNIGGYCEEEGCDERATAFFRERHLCRECMMNADLDQPIDMINERFNLQSSMGWFDTED